MSASNFRPDIEGLRGVAVLAVVLFHFDVLYISGGFLGVDIFFVISGYVISQSILGGLEGDGKFSYREFYGKRARRILPALFVIIIFSHILGFIFFSGRLYDEMSMSSIYSAISISNFYFMSGNGYFDSSAVEKPLLHLWSLSVEEQFYLIWPYLWIFLLGILSPFKRIISLLVLIAVFIIVSELWVRSDDVAGYFMMPARFFEFMVGAFAVLLEKKWCERYQKSNNVLFIFGLSGLVCCLFLYSEEIIFPGVWAFPPVLLTMIVIVTARHSAGGSLLVNKYLRFYGKISYSFYLVHWPLVVFYKYVRGYEMSMLSIVSLVVVATFLAYLMWRFVEEPFRRKKHGVFQISTKKMYGFFLACIVLVTGVSLFSHNTDGMMWRIGEEKMDLYTNYNSDKYRHRIRNGLKPPAPFEVYFGDLDTEPATVALIGDSHAYNFRMGLDELLSENDIRGIQNANTGCIPVYGASVIHEKSLGFFDFCKRRTQNTLDKVLNDEDIKIVFIAARWSFYTRNYRLGEVGNKGNIYLGTALDDIRSQERSEEIFKATVKATVQKFTSADKKVVLFGQVPNIGFDVTRCLFSPPMLENLFGDCQPSSKKDVLENQSFTNAILQRIAESDSNVLFLNGLVPFEREGGYKYIEDNHILYSDSNHLIYEGSMISVRYYKDQILDFLNDGNK